MVPGISLAKFSLETLKRQYHHYLHAPDVLNRVENAQAHGQLHLGQANLLDCIGKVLAHMVLRVVQNDDLTRSIIFVTYRLLVLHVSPNPPQELDYLWLLRALNNLMVERAVVCVHRTEDADAGAAPRQPAKDLLALLLPQISRPVPGICSPIKHD